MLWLKLKVLFSNSVSRSFRHSYSWLLSQWEADLKRKLRTRNYRKNVRRYKKKLEHSLWTQTTSHRATMDLAVLRTCPWRSGETKSFTDSAAAVSYMMVHDVWHYIGKYIIEGGGRSMTPFVLCTLSSMHPCSHFYKWYNNHSIPGEQMAWDPSHLHWYHKPDSFRSSLRTYVFFTQHTAQDQQCFFKTAATAHDQTFWQPQMER
jgi:hypothetical protein